MCFRGATTKGKKKESILKLLCFLCMLNCIKEYNPMKMDPISKQHSSCVFRQDVLLQIFFSAQISRNNINEVIRGNKGMHI